MDKSISILDKDYLQWVQELCKRYQRCQIKAAVKVNQEMLRFYWELGRDIIELDIEKKWGEKVIRTLSADLKREIPNATGFSRTNLYYIRSFYCLYSELNAIVPQIEGQLSSHSKKSIVPQLGGQSHSSVVSLMEEDIFALPWGHHKLLIDKCSNNRDKALFYVNLSLKNGWSRAVLLNVLDTNLYERSGKLSSIMSYSHSPYLWLSVAAETGILWKNCGWSVRRCLFRILRDWCVMTHTH